MYPMKEDWYVQGKGGTETRGRGGRSTDLKKAE